MAYSIDLSIISLEDFEDRLHTRYLPPSREILRKESQTAFKVFNDQGIDNLNELYTFLKNKANWDVLSSTKNIGIPYLTILFREIKSYIAKPIQFKDLIGISIVTLQKLSNAKINNTKKLYDLILTPENRQELRSELRISEDEILELTKLTDLSRVKWIGPLFIDILYNVGVDTVEKLQNSDPEELFIWMQDHIQINQRYSGPFTVKDSEILIEASKDLSLDIEY